MMVGRSLSLARWCGTHSLKVFVTLPTALVFGQLLFSAY